MTEHTGATGPTGATGATRARALAVDDQVVRDGESVVLVGDRVILLSALATALLEACPDWTDLVALTDHLLARFGPPEDGDPVAATRAAAQELYGQGLVDLA